MTERIFVDTDDIIILDEDRKDVNKVRRDIYRGLNGEEAEVAICVWMYTPKRLEKLRNCIDSIMKYTKHIKFKLVLTNNGGGKEIEEYYESIDYSDKMIIDISTNISSPHGLSVIQRYVKNKFCVEVLNDCIVTENWLDNMLRCINSDESIGMVVPMSTNTSNMQEPCTGNIDLRNHNEIQNFAKTYNISDPLKWEQRMRLMPICGLYRRETLEVAGISDQGYLHEFADDDHCMRIRRAGYKLMLCGDTVVHHDHFMDERNQLLEQSNTNIGRNGYINKFKGLDPWLDFGNFVFPYLSDIKLDNKKDKYKILGIDVKCGTPILDVKNLYRKNGIEMSRINTTAYTQEIKYYTDLLTVSDYVIHNDINMVNNEIEGKYDFIIIGECLNNYSKPILHLERIVNKLEDGGYLMFFLKNINNVNTLLNVIGERRIDGVEEVVMLYYWDVVSKLKEMNIKQIKLFTEKYTSMKDEIETIKESMIRLGIVSEYNKSVTNEWDVYRYCFLIQK